MIFFDFNFNTAVIVRDALKSKVYLGEMINSLCTAVMDIPNEANTLDVAIQKYGVFFEVLRNELRKQGIEIVLIGEATDVIGCRIATLEMTPDGIFICENEKREEVRKLQDILAYISPEDIIGRVISAMTDHQHKSLIDRLELDLKYVKDLIENKCNTPEESDEIPCDRSEGKRKRKTKDEQLS